MDQKQKGARVYAALNQIAEEYAAAKKKQHAAAVRQAMQIADIGTLARLYEILTGASEPEEPARDEYGRTAQDRYDDEWGDPLDTDLRY